ncbi:succinate dehydrogenase assembly factor 2 [Haplosporangium sp. Z 767]|nr:succinate dehydrogenase assembly factor 2 [Haplosporangium sp. Z 767]
MKAATAERDHLAAQANKVLSPKIKRYQMCMAQRSMAAEHSAFIAEERRLLLAELEQDRQKLARLKAGLNQRKETLKLSMARYQVSKMNGPPAIKESINDTMESWASVHQKLGHSRRVLVAELVTLFDLKCDPERRRNPINYNNMDQSVHSNTTTLTGTTVTSENGSRRSTKLRVRDYLEEDSWNEYLIVGRSLPTGYFENYDRDEINTTIENVIHMMTLVACYLGIKLPFDTVTRHSRYYIKAAFTAGSKRTPLFLSDDNLLLFAAGIAHLNYNIAYLCHSQGVHITLANAANTLENLLACCEAPNLGRYTNYASIMTKRHEGKSDTRSSHVDEMSPISPTSDDGGFENIHSDLNSDPRKFQGRNEHQLWCPGQEPFDLNVQDLISLIRSRREEESSVWGGLHLQDAVAANLGTLEDDFMHEDQEEEDGMYTIRPTDGAHSIGVTEGSAPTSGPSSRSAINSSTSHMSQNRSSSMLNLHHQRRPAHPSRDRRWTSQPDENPHRIQLGRETSDPSLGTTAGHGQPENWTFLDVDIFRVPSSANKGSGLLSGRGWPDISALRKVGSAVGGAAVGLVNGAAHVAAAAVAVRQTKPASFAVWRSFSTKSTSSESGTPGRVQDHDDARDVDPDVFQTPYTNLPPLPRDPDETLETIRARLTYQSRKRGILETDLILSTFAKEFLSTMTLDECRRFDKFMDEPDWDIYYWVTGKKQVPEKWQNDPVFERIVKHAKNEGRVVRQMPAL